MREEIKPTTIIQNYHLYNPSLPKTFDGETLVYVTPWNKKGYDLTKAMLHKLSWIVPVWFGVR